jgi:hypothetical protein
VKFTVALGASIPDPSRLFNCSLEGNTRRAIDIHEGEKIDAGAFKTLVKAAVAENGAPWCKLRRGAHAYRATASADSVLSNKVVRRLPTFTDDAGGFFERPPNPITGS